MKKLMNFGLAIFLMAGTTSAEAQFLKKLKDKVEKKVENAAIKNISDKAADETNKSLNNMWTNQLENSQFAMGMDMVDPAEIPEGYDFDWEYNLKMKTTEGEMDMLYHIKEDAPYVGIRFPQTENMFTVLDNKRDMTVIYMNSEGNKIVMATRIDVPEEDMDTENPYKDMEFEEIGTKTILGFECRGYRSENTENVFEFYVTDEAGVSFRDIYQENQKNIPEGLKADWIKDGTGLMMEMHMKDKKNPDKNVTMTCTRVERNLYSIKTSDYQSMNMGGR